MKGGSNGQADGAINVVLVNWFSSQDALTCMGNNDTCSRPSIDLRRNPAAYVLNDAVEL